MRGLVGASGASKWCALGANGRRFWAALNFTIRRRRRVVSKGNSQWMRIHPLALVT